MRTWTHFLRGFIATTNAMGSSVLRFSRFLSCYNLYSWSCFPSSSFTASTILFFSGRFLKRRFFSVLINFFVRDKFIGNQTATNKISLRDAILPMDASLASMGFLTWLFIIVTVFVWTLRLIGVVSEAFRNWEIKSFFNTVLSIPDVSKQFF